LTKPGEKLGLVAPFEARLVLAHRSPFAIKGLSAVRRAVGSEALTINLTPNQKSHS
jgi:hypothetical protein